MKIYHEKDRTPITWASGTSTELYIYPADGDFKTRQFTFRISTATVEAEETTFSDFSGLTRILMPLKGALTLMHEGRYTKELKPFDQDRFDGSWATRSRGKVQDFNVMFKPHIDAEVIHHAGTAGSHTQLPPTLHHHFLYIHSGEFLVNDQHISEGDFIHIPSNTEIKLTCQTPGHAVEVKLMEG